MRKIFMLSTIAFCAMFVTGANAQTINGNGTTFTNSGGANQGQAISGSGGWYYNNVRVDGVVGITTDYTNNGNGSVYFSTSGNSSSKADIEFLSGGLGFGGNYYASTSLGKLGELTSLSYDWYRDSSSTNSAVQHPVVRMFIDADGDLSTAADRGYLIFEQAYNGSNVQVNQWVSEDIFTYNGGAGAYLWNSTIGSLPTAGSGGLGDQGFGKTLTDWKNGVSIVNGNSAILGFSMGVGSGWGQFVGAVDNFSYGFNGGVNTFNFEAIPEPNSLILAGMAIMGMVATKGRRRRAA